MGHGVFHMGLDESRVDRAQSTISNGAARLEMCKRCELPSGSHGAHPHDVHGAAPTLGIGATCQLFNAGEPLDEISGMAQDSCDDPDVDVHVQRRHTQINGADIA